MYIYKETIGDYFRPCSNCGDCCKIPGLFLPQQVEGLAEHFGISARELFDRHLIAELGHAGDNKPVVLVLSPVKMDRAGTRLPHRIIDAEYSSIRDHYCIFYDTRERKCTIHAMKPFDCDTMLCAKMTGSKPFSLDKGYFYHQWVQRQDLVHSMFPGLGRLHASLIEGAHRVQEAIELRNRTINEEVAQIVCGKTVKSLPFNP